MKKALILTKREIVVPTAFGWVLIFTLLALFFTLLIFNIQSYLSPTAPVRGNALIVEGWMRDDAMEMVVDIFNERDYEYVFVTGGVLEEGSFLSDYGTYAHLGAATLNALGIADTFLHSVPAPQVRKDRTLTSALALKEMLEQMDHNFISFDLCSFDVHSRRSGHLFRTVLGKEYTIGIIAIPDSSYDPAKWWNSSAGFRNVVSEGIAYMYARLFF
ncbi:hypothetical protein QA601_14665 [Chitinispirillales bacterium ANBcel5]|uniref:YdcF family protein n=1 Tax=Cellulosispirillum alkaliphilum TaxID=3039283 RepID=UPI002A50B4BC|nr:hypothetical protein [Chitinispirillales bacterium ANBcel5]